MISALNSGALQFLNSVNYLQSSLQKVQTEISSGLRVTSASDAPDEVSPILQLHANIQHNQQIQENLNVVQGEVTTADSSLSSGITLLDQVQTLASEGLGLGATADTRTQLAGQVNDLMQQMVSLSNTQVDGRYIFSGDNDQSASYQYDAASVTGVDRLQLSTGTRKVEDPNGGTFAVGLTANQIFDARDSNDNPTTGNVFAAMNAVRVALLGNDTSGLQAAVSAVKDASTYLNQQQTFYGNVETHITTALTNASNANVAYQKDLSNRQDADQTQAIVQMQQYTTNLQAAMETQAKMPTGTLFDLIQG